MSEVLRVVGEPTEKREYATLERTERDATQRRSVLQQVLRHRSGLVGLVGLLVVGVVAVAGPFVLPYDPSAADFADKLAAPSAAHLFGTDYLGRDLLSRVVDAAHRSLGAALIVVAGTMVLSLTLGSLAGFGGSIVDPLIMRLIDIQLALPSLVLALALVGVLGPSLQTLMIALILAQAPWYTRLFRTMVLRERERPYVLVARVHGATAPAIVWRHVLPAVLGQLSVVASLDLGNVILAVAGLSFLGLGAQPPDAEWGAMLNDGRLTFFQHSYSMIVPGVAILCTALMANLLGDALRDVLDPGLRQRA